MTTKTSVTPNWLYANAKLVRQEVCHYTDEIILDFEHSGEEFRCVGSPGRYIGDFTIVRWPRSWENMDD